MSRFEKKCFIGSAAFHGLLLVAFLFGSAFFSGPKPQSVPVMTLVAIPTDLLVSTGGNPKGNSEPPAPAPQPKPEPPPPQPIKQQQQPEPPKPEVKPEPKPKEVPKPKELVKEVPKEKAPVLTKKEPEKKPPINTNVVVIRTDTLAQRREAERRAAEAKAAREAEVKWRAQQQALASEIKGIIGGVGQSIGKTTIVEPLGDGGAAYVHYGSLVGEIYKRAVYASHPQSDEDATAVIRVVITRSGSVKDADWVRRTGDSALDKAVDRAMKTVRAVPPFPEGSKDSERTFNINIGFEAKRVTA